MNGTMKAILAPTFLAITILLATLLGVLTAPNVNTTLVGQLGGASHAVDEVGNVAYVGVGSRVMVFDVTSPTNPVLLDQSEPLADVVEGIKFFNGLLYVADGDSGLYILNPATSGVPVVSSFDTLGLANDVALVTNTPKTYAFIADGTNGVVAIDVTNSSSPAMASLYNYKPVGGSAAEGIAADGLNLFVAYGTQGVHAFKPFEPGGAVGYYTVVGTYLKDVAVQSGYLYLADAGYGLRIVSWNGGTNSFSNHGAYAMHMSNVQALTVNSTGSRAYMVGMGPLVGSIEVVNITSKVSPTFLGDFDLPNEAFGVVIDTGFAHAYVADGAGGFRVLNVSAPASIIENAITESVGLPQNIALSGDYGFVADGPAGLKILNMADPANPQVLYQSQKQSVTDVINFSDVAITGTHAFVTDDLLGLRVYDVGSLTAPITPTEVATITLYDFANGIEIQGNYAYIATGVEGLQVVDISNPLALSVTGSYSDASSTSFDVSVMGNYAYLADGGNGMKIVDISNPATPVLAATYIETPTVSNAAGVARYGNYAYIADSDQGVHIVDVTTPTLPSPVSFIATAGSATDVIPAGPYYILVADHTGGMRVVDISDPANPIEVGRYDTAGAAVGGAFDGYAHIASDEGGLYNITALETDLSISVTDNMTTATQGTNLIYSITINNSGSHHAAGVTISDVFPSALTNVSWLCTAAYAAECLTPSGTGAFTTTGTGDMNTQINVKKGGIVFITAHGTVSATTGTVIENTAELLVPAGIDKNAANNRATDTTATAITDLTIGKTAHAAAVIPGEAITYTVTVTNTGAQSVSGATVSDGLPAGMNNAQWRCVALSGAACPVPANGSGDISAAVDLPSGGGKVTFTITGTVASTATGSLSNTATIASSPAVYDSNLSNNTASASVTLTPVADLQISKVGDFGGLPGTAITYTLVVTNFGPSSASASVQDTLPTTVTNAIWLCAASTGSSCAPSGSGSLSETISLLPSGTATFTIKGTVSPFAGVGSMDNIATISPLGDASDPVVENNMALDSVSILAPQTDLQISLTDGTGVEVPGTSVQYTLTAANNGPADAAGAIVTGTFPAILSGVSWTCTPSLNANCAASGTGNISETVDIPAGGHVYFTVNATLDSAASGTMTATAGVIVPAGTTDTNANNNVDSDVDTFDPQADLGVGQSATGSGISGQAYTYTLTIDNNGPSDVASAVISDTFPSQLTGVSWKCATLGGATCTANGTGNLNETVDLPAGSSAIFTATGTISTNSTVQISNRADISAPSGPTDPNTANNSNTLQTTIYDNSSFDLTLGVTAPSAVKVYDTFTYTLTISNSGPSRAPNVQVVDTLPSGVTFVSASAGCTHSGTVTCDIAGIDAGNQVILEIVVQATPAAVPATLASSISVSGNGLDNNLDDNTASVDVTVNPYYFDLSVAATAPSVVTIRDVFTYTLTINNSGPDRAPNVELIALLPSGATFMSASTGCVYATSVTCNIASISAGNQSIIEIVMQANDTVNATILTNNISVSGDGVDGNQLDNTYNLNVTVNPFQIFLPVIFR